MMSEDGSEHVLALSTCYGHPGLCFGVYGNDDADHRSSERFLKNLIWRGVRVVRKDVLKLM